MNRDELVRHIKSGEGDPTINRRVAASIVGITSWGAPIFRDREYAAHFHRGTHDLLTQPNTIESPARFRSLDTNDPLPVHSNIHGRCIGSTKPYFKNGVVIGYIFTQDRSYAVRQTAWFVEPERYGFRAAVA